MNLHYIATISPAWCEPTLAGVTAADAHGAGTISPAWCEPTLAGVTAADAHGAARCAPIDGIGRGNLSNVKLPSQTECLIKILLSSTDHMTI